MVVGEVFSKSLDFGNFISETFIVCTGNGRDFEICTFFL